MGKYIDGSGLSHFMGIIKGWAVPKTRKVNGHALSADVTVTASDIGVASGAEVNQNAFSNVKVGSTTVAADAKTDTLELVGSNVTLTPDATNDKVTIGITDSNVNAALGTKPVARATGDADGNAIADYYVKKTFMVDGVSFERDDAAMRYVICDTAAGTATKDIIINGCADYSNIPIGLVVYVEFANTNTAAVANLKFQLKAPYTGGSGYANVGSATAIKYRGGNLPSVGTLAANRIYAFVYDGTNWELMGDLDTNSDTKNTAGSTDSSSKLFIIGATSQAENPQTYSQDTAYVGTDGHLYSNSVQVVNLSASQALTNKTYNGYTLGAACAKGVDTSISSGSTSTNVPTTAAVVNYMASVAGALVYKGTVGTDGTVTDLPANHTKGWYYVVKTAGTYAGFVCEAGDMIICNTSGTSANNTHWDAVQSNIEVLSNSEIDTLWAAA